MQEKTLLLGKEKINYKIYESTKNVVDILIIHWWWGKSDSWTDVADILFEKWYNVIVPDLPWFWKTEITKVYTLNDYAQTLEEFCKKLKLEQCVVWGHSNGGAISITMAQRKKIHIERLVLNNSAGIRRDEKRNVKRKILHSLTQIIKKIIPNINKNSWKKGLFSKIRNLFYRIIWWQDYLEAEKNPFLKQTYLHMIGSDLQENIKNIELDTLLIRGEKDTYTPVSDAHIMRKTITNSKLIVLENETHGIHLKNPELLVQTFIDNI